MTRFTYKRDAVPVGEQIFLEVDFTDSAGNKKDADSTPTITITDAASSTVLATTSSLVIRTSEGHYRYLFTVPSGHISGIWNDRWAGVMDGYSMNNTFDFTVSSDGDIEATTTTVEPTVEIGDEPEPEPYTQLEIKNINKLLKRLQDKLRSIAFKPDGSRCDVFAVEMLADFLSLSLSEFNATPTITNYSFADSIIVTTFSDIITQGAMLMAWTGQIAVEIGFEFQINDNGTNFIPPQVSTALNNIVNANLADYRAKLKEIKRNLRAHIPLGMGAGSILVASPAARRLRHLKEKRILY